MVEQDQLDQGQIEKLVASLHALEHSHPGLAETLQREANYFEQNKERMRYPAFRQQAFSWGRGSSKLVAKRWSAGSNNRACSGRSGELTPSSPSVAVSSAGNSRITGTVDGHGANLTLMSCTLRTQASCSRAAVS